MITIKTNEHLKIATEALIGIDRLIQALDNFGEPCPELRAIAEGMANDIEQYEQENGHSFDSPTR